MSGQKFTEFKMKSSSSSTSSSTSRQIQSKFPLPANVSQGFVKPQYGSNSNFSRKHLTEEDYFEDAEDEQKNQLEYQPASDTDSSESEEDPLDAFMSGIEVTTNFYENYRKN
jgi:hypothetical protein